MFISSDSFWIDEGNTAYKAVQAGLREWFRAMHEVTGSDSQMPGYMIYVWAWEKLVPRSEFFLRLSNLPWLLLLVMSLRHFRYAACAALCSPFVLAYLGELRPYLMQLAGAALAADGLRRFEKPSATAWIVVLAGCLIMCLASLIGAVWSLGVMAYAFLRAPQFIRSAAFWKVSAAFAPVYAGLGAYYAWTLANGQEAAMMGGSLVTSIGAAGYELLGLAGLGPGKLELRTNPESITRYTPVILPAVAAILSLTAVGLIQWVRGVSRHTILATVIGVSLPTAILFALVVLKGFRLLGRHLAPLEILLILLCSLATADLLSRKPASPSRPRLSALLPLAVLCLWLASALSLRIAPRHRKDDYRGAAQIALKAMSEGRPVIWVADRYTGYFYGLNKDLPGWQVWRENLPIPTLAGNECVLLTKPDIYDSRGEFARHLADNGFVPVTKLAAFTVFKRPEATAESPR